MTISEFVNKIGFKVKNEDVNKVNGAISDIKSTATKLLGAIGIGFSLSSINGLIEEFGAINKSITSSLGELDNVDEAQKKILDGANAVRTSYGDMANTVSNLMKSDESLFPIDDAITFTSNVTKLMKTSGRTESAIQSMMEGFNKSFQKGIVDTETLNKMLEQCPETANLLAEKTGYAKTKLLDMASQGTLKVQDLKDAFISATDEIDKEFAKSGMSISSALQNIRNKWGFWLVQQNKTFGVTNAIGKALVSAFDKGMSVLNKISNGLKAFADKIGGTENLLKLVAIAAGAIFLAFNFGKIVDGLQKVATFIGAIKLKTLLLVAVIAFIALLIDDFINFMQGNDSVIGLMFDKIGIGADNAREAIKSAWDNIVAAIKACKEVAVDVFGKIKDGIDGFVDGIKNGIDWLKKHETALGLVAIAVGTLTAAIVAYNIAQAIKNAGGIVELAQLAATAIGIGALTAAETAHTVAATIGTAVTTAFGAAMAFLTSPITLVILAIGALIAIIYVCIKHWDDIKAAAAACWDWICGVWNTAASWFNTNVIQPIVNFFTGLFNSITSIVGNIKTSIVNGFTAAIDWIKALPGQALQWGKDIIMGIVNGIKSCISAVGDAVKGVANTIKNFLHFSEPDEGPLSDFHTYMPDMIDLMSKGITAGKSKVKDALGDLTGEMSVMAKADVVGASTASAVRGGNNVSKSVVQKVEINNEFNGDAAIQRSASSAMDNSARDVTAQLARGLAFAR